MIQLSYAYINCQANIKWNLFILYCKACAPRTIESVAADGRKHCKHLPDCSGIECCFDNAFYLGNRSIYFMLKMDCTNLEFQIESKKIIKSLATLTDGKKINPECQVMLTYFTDWTVNSFRIWNFFSFTDVENVEIVGNPPSFQFNYTVKNNVQSYSITAKLMVGGIITDPAGMVIYKLLDRINSRIYKPPTCPSTTSRRRRKKRMIDVNK